MDWNMIAAVSSLFGSIGVVLTVFYLAVQIRQNTSSVEGSTAQSLVSIEGDLNRFLAEYAEVYCRGAAGLNGLDPVDLFRFEQLFSAYLTLTANALLQFQHKLLEPDDFESFKEDLLKEVRKPGCLEMWHQLRYSYAPDFRDMMKELENKAQS